MAAPRDGAYISHRRRQIRPVCGAGSTFRRIHRAFGPTIIRPGGLACVNAEQVRPGPVPAPRLVLPSTATAANRG